MLKRAQAKHGLYSVQTRAEQLPFADGTFDRVIVVDALHHFFDQQAAIRDLIRVLKPEGRLVIEEPDRNRLIVKILVVAEKMAFMRSRIHTMTEILDMVTAEGMTACIEHGNGFASWSWPIRKIILNSIDLKTLTVIGVAPAFLIEIFMEKKICF